MRLAPKLIGLIAFATAGLLSFFSATFAVTVIETRSAEGVNEALQRAGHPWVDVQTNGLLVILSGEAPTESLRFRALTVAGTVVDAERVIDTMDVTDPLAIRPPDFAIEVLRNDDGISLIGLIPAATGRETVVENLTDLAGEGRVTDMLETADHPTPEGWGRALDFGLDALELLPRSKISISADRVAITAITDSAAQKARVEAELSRRAPSRLRLALDISAPRPVITPFTLRFVIDEAGAHFDACSADTDAARRTILASATGAGLVGKADCTVGMGVPTPEWATATSMAVAALGDLGAGSVTFSDADVTLIAADSVAQADFDRVVGELDSNLPEVFSLHAVLTEKPDEAASEDGPPQFNASLSSEGLIQLRGRLTDARSRDAVESFARARFGNSAVYTAARLDPGLPNGWPLRVLAALEALAELNYGTVNVQPDLVRITGVTGSTESNAAIARILAARLGDSQKFEIKVRYDRKLDPLLGLPTAQECVDQINAFLDASKISFEPGSSTITSDAADTLDKIAARMKDCSEFPMQIGGHTDSQGREEMNLALSQQRAQAVIAALMERRVLTGNLDAEGFGESLPIADNETEEGREANRRIEFTLIAPEEENAVVPGDGEGTPGVIVEEADETTPAPLPRPEGIAAAVEEAIDGENETEAAPSATEADDADASVEVVPTAEAVAADQTGDAPEDETDTAQDADALTETAPTAEASEADQTADAVEDQGDVSPATEEVLEITVQEPDETTPRPLARPASIETPAETSADGPLTTDDAPADDAPTDDTTATEADSNSSETTPEDDNPAAGN